MAVTCAQAVILDDWLPASGTHGALGTIRNASCISAALNVEVFQTSSLPSAAVLMLLDARGLQDLYNNNNNASQRLTPLGGCQAGLNSSSCKFTTTGLQSTSAYHVSMFFSGTADASWPLYHGNNGFILATVASGTSTGKLRVLQARCVR